jgi:hypothetical protein
MGFIFFILIFVLLVGLIILSSAFSIVMTILRGIFSFGKSPKSTSYTTTSPPSTQNKKERIFFDKAEAEDAEYEEIK